MPLDPKSEYLFKNNPRREVLCDIYQNRDPLATSFDCGNPPNKSQFQGDKSVRIQVAIEEYFPNI